MPNLNFNLAEIQGTEEMVIMCYCKTPSPTPGDFAQANINYSALTASEKATVDAFIALVKSKC